MTLTVKERITKSLDILRNLEVKAATEQDKGILNRFMTSFNNMNNPKSSDISLTILKDTYTAVKAGAAQCPQTPPAPTPTKDTKIPAVPKATKKPTKKDFSEIEGQVCKQLPTQLGSNSTTSSRDGKPIEELKQPDKPTFDWGIKFTYDPTEQNYGLTCTPNTGVSLNSSEGKQEWYMTLLPAMKSQMPKSPGMDTPNAMPGLQFQLKSNIAKHRIPGSQPVYQHLGIDTVMVTIVGCFTGDGGKKTRQESVTSPNQYANSMNPNISKDGKTIYKNKLTEEEQKILEVANTIGGRASITIKDSEILGLVAEQTKKELNDIRPLIFSIQKKGYVWRLNKFIDSTHSQAEINTYSRASTDGYFIDNETTSLNKGKDSNLATIEGDTLTTRNTLKNEGVNTTWMQNPNMRQCDPCIGVIEQAERLDSYHEFTSFQRLSYNRELEVEINLEKNNDGRAPQKNKYEEWGWNATSAKTQKDADWGPLRNGENGNPRFKGVIRGMEVYYARQDRTWYLMTLEVTDLGLSSDVPLNLIKELTEAAEAAVEDTAESVDSTKDLQDANARLDCILQQGNGMFTEPNDVGGTTNRAYIAGNAFGGGELIAWDMFTGEGMKYKMEKTFQDGKEIRYAKANSEVLTPQEVGQVLADTNVNLISAASGGVWDLRVDSAVRKRFFLTLYERGAIDYKPSGISDDVLQSEVVGDISSGDNQEAEKALQLLCKSIYTTNRKFDAGEKVDAGAQQYSNKNRTLTTLTLPELATKANELGGNTTEAQLGVLINAWTSENRYIEDHGLKIFQDLRMIKQGTCKGFGLAIANIPSAKWQLITPYGLFKQILDSSNANTEGDLSFLLKYIDIKTNPYQSGYVAFADGSGSKDPTLKISDQKACFSDMRSGDMDSNTPGMQGIDEINGGQYNQYDPLAAGDTLPLEGLSIMDAVLGLASTFITCGVDFIPAIVALVAAILAGIPTMAVGTILGILIAAVFAILAIANCLESISKIISAAKGKEEYDQAGAAIDILVALIPEVLGRGIAKELIEKALKGLGDNNVIKKAISYVIDKLTSKSQARQDFLTNPIKFIGDAWKDIWDAIYKQVPSLEPFIMNIKNSFEDLWIAIQNIYRKVTKQAPLNSRGKNAALELGDDFLYKDPDLLTYLNQLKTNGKLNSFSESSLPPIDTVLIKPGIGEQYTVVSIIKDSKGNPLKVKVKDYSGAEEFIDINTLADYFDGVELANKSAQIKQDMLIAKNRQNRITPVPTPTPIPNNTSTPTTPVPTPTPVIITPPPPPPRPLLPPATTVTPSNPLPNPSSSYTVGNVNNYINQLINPNISISPQNIYKAYQNALTKNSDFMSKQIVPNQFKDLSVQQQIQSIDSLMKNSQFLDSQGRVLDYSSFDSVNGNIIFKTQSGELIEHNIYISTESLFDITTATNPLNPQLDIILKQELENIIISPDPWN